MLLLIIFAMTLTWNHAKASKATRDMADRQPEQSIPQEKFDFYWSQMPTVCADRMEVVKWLDKHMFAPVSMSFGRENGRPEGTAVYVVTIFVNDNYSMAATVETPTSDEVCILFRTYDMQLNPALKPQGLTL